MSHFKRPLSVACLLMISMAVGGCKPRRGSTIVWPITYLETNRDAVISLGPLRFLFKDAVSVEPFSGSRITEHTNLGNLPVSGEGWGSLGIPLRAGSQNLSFRYDYINRTN